MRSAGKNLDTASRLLAVALAKPRTSVAWLCPTAAVARNRLREMAERLRDNEVGFGVLAHMFRIRLRNGSAIDFLPVGDRRQADRLRGLDLDAVAASPWEVGSQVVRDTRFLLINRGGELI